MENAELDVALEELESRLERLRALYEQYFMGIERIEPAIPRKDIDRRIYVLRREKIRNTAKRFKLQTIISRYNTFQQYWQRICREIEAGTYKRHVIKAERILPGKLLTIAARKRLGRHAFDDVEAEPAPPSAPPSAPAQAKPASSVPAPPSAPPSAPAAAASAVMGVKGAPPAKPLPPPKPGVPPPKPGMRPAKPPAPAPIAATPFESMDLDMDFMGDWDPSSAPAKPARGGAPARPFGEALARPLGAAPIKSPAQAAVAAPVRAPAPIAAPIAAPKAAPPSAGNPAKVAPAPGLPAPYRAAAAPPAPTPPKPAVVAPAPTPLKPAVVAPAPTPLKPAVVAPAPEPARAAAKPAPAGAISPAAKLGAAPIAKAPKPVATPNADLTDARVRELHARLLEAKRETKDAGPVSLEGLAKSLKATEAKLREQHKNRRIDFDVVIKDGKAILKPTVR